MLCVKYPLKVHVLIMSIVFMMLVLQERKQIRLGVLDLLLGLFEMSVFLVQKFLCAFIFVPLKLNTETLSGETRRGLL